MQYLSEVARPLNLSLGLKNGKAIISAVLPLVDFSVNEQCAQYNECGDFQPFVAAGKPVFHIEYDASTPSPSASVISNVCNNGTSINGFSTVLKNSVLDAWLYACS